MNARQTAAFWIEHVLQYGGEHLRPTSMQLTWWQLYCLDTLAVIFSVVFFVLLLVYVLLQSVVRRLLRLLNKSNHEKKD